MYKVVKKEEHWTRYGNTHLTRTSIYDNVLRQYGICLEYPPLQTVYPKKGYIFAVNTLRDALDIIFLSKYNCETEPTFEIWECEGEPAPRINRKVPSTIQHFFDQFDKAVMDRLVIDRKSVFLKSCTLTRLVTSYE